MLFLRLNLKVVHLLFEQPFHFIYTLNTGHIRDEIKSPWKFAIRSSFKIAQTRVRNYWLSDFPGHPKTLSESQFFLQGFPTGKPVKIKFLVR